MKKWIMLALVVAIGAPLLATQTNATEDIDRLVEFQGRKIDLQPYIDGFPYRGFNPSYDAGKLFYYHVGETTKLKSLALKNNPDLDKGETISDIDFSKRNVWGIRSAHPSENDVIAGSGG